MAILIAMTACARAAPTTAPAPPSLSDRLADTVWYISARARDAGHDTRRFADSLEFGYAIHSYRRRADALAGALSMTLDDSVQLTREAFVQALHGVAGTDGAPETFALLYVHGYGTALHECWQHASESRIRSRSGVPWVAFCWPSGGSGVAPPRRGAILDAGYRSDSAVAWASRPAFVRSAEVMLDALPASRLLLVAHSMGAQILGSALSDSSALRTRLLEQPVRAISFVSADVEANRFLDSIAPAVRPLASRLVAYVSGRDRMLALSRRRSGGARAGQRSRTPRAFETVETVDATNGIAAENRLQHLVGTHHALRRASSILFDLLHVVGARRAPACRLGVETATQDAFGIWKLTSIRPDTIRLAERCPSPPR
ncbi:alpha/beta hydrolase [Gemmatimonas sp.]|uniref:alpha/beta hydrolase n=1 Tax=Gemmatimonas sp. TaxID=1962908 RepID=UPI00398319BF